VKNWASSLAGASPRDTLLRAGLAVVLVGALVWFLPVRRPGEDTGHHAGQAASALDPFEKAGVTEFNEGQRAPALALRTLPGSRAALHDFRERLVVLNFWATWCQPCTLEMPTLEALAQEYRDRGLVVLGVSVDRGAPLAVISPYVKNMRLTFPILLDPDMAAATAWRVTALPATFLVRPGGEVAGVAVGAREWNSDEMKALIERLLPGAHATH
jgi:peroxiredoxin